MPVTHLTQWSVHDVGERVAVLAVCGSISAATWRAAATALAAHFRLRPFGAVVVEAQSAQFDDDVLSGKAYESTPHPPAIIVPAAFVVPPYQVDALRRACLQLAIRHGRLRVVFSSGPDGLNWARQRAAALGIPATPSCRPPELRASPARMLERA